MSFFFLISVPSSDCCESSLVAQIVTKVKELGKIWNAFLDCKETLDFYVIDLLHDSCLNHSQCKIPDVDNHFSNNIQNACLFQF